MKKVLSILTFLSLCLLCQPSISQTVLKKGDIIKTIAVNKLLNYSTTLTSFNFESNITIIDFFGTWCAPCLRSLPNLKNIKHKFKNDVSIILISNETEARLTTFIEAQNNFDFPILIDDGNQLNNLFQPPSLPYTVVINKSGKIIDITENITEESVEKWLSDTVLITSANIISLKNEPQYSVMNLNRQSTNMLVKLSQDLIYKAKTSESIDDVSKQLRHLNYSTLVSLLKNDNDKKAFWINLYNGYTQAALKIDPGKYKNRKAFFKTKQIEIADTKFSLDDIEHGLLRHSKIKWSLGYLDKLFPSKKEKQLRVNFLDYRIHFSLNCGAKSCPPVSFYTPDKLDSELELAIKAYLLGEVEYDSINNIIKLPTLMSWFRGDFGGKKGMVRILKRYHIISSDINPKVRFKKYDWTLTLNSYKNEN